MVKVFVTGDNHFGLSFSSYPEEVGESRYESFRRMVHKANEEGCNLFVITGDLFDTPYVHKRHKKVVKRVTDILSEFTGESVLVLPGNHDYYSKTDSDGLWPYFMEIKPSNTIVMNEFRKYELTIDEDTIAIYPAFCDSKHGEENNIGWIKCAQIDSNSINIGIAHGAIEGKTIDKDNKYFPMTEKELNAINNIDAWLIGHTHVPFPDDLETENDKTGYKIFNAGTHEQPDINTDTEGIGFIISIDKKDGKAKVMAHKYISGKIRFYKEDVVIPDSEDEDSLKKALEVSLAKYSDNSIIRLTVKGSIGDKEYADKEKICDELLKRFLFYDPVNFKDLTERITVDRIRERYSEESFIAKLLEAIDDPVARQMAYNLAEEYMEDRK